VYKSVGRSRISFCLLLIVQLQCGTNSRKVRAPWAGLPGNTWAPWMIAVTESATEIRPPFERAVRVKRWGKSPPRSRQRERLGKPQLEQGKACGESCHLVKDAAGMPLERASDCSSREMIVAMAAAIRQNPAYRPMCLIYKTPCILQGVLSLIVDR
jgi:hypothetical protein